jgi:hypothetical protein
MHWRWNMQIKKSSRILLLATALTVGVSVGCGETAEPGDLIEETHIMGLEGARRVSAEIEMGLGKLAIGGGSEDMLDAEFVYNVEDWKPVIRYSVADGLGELVIKQHDSKTKSFGRGVKCEWDLRFGDKVPLDLIMEVGAGECRMDLEDLPVSGLDLTFGAGDVELIIGGSRTLSDLDLEAGAGDIMLDLTGDWDVDMDARIKAGVGRVRVRLPEDTGVRVKTQKGIGKVSMSGLRRKGSYYVNEAYGDSDATLYIEVETGIGAIELRVGEAEDEGVTI